MRKAIADDRAIPFSNIMQMTRRQWRTNTPLHAGPLQAAQSRLMVEYLLYADQDRDGKADHAEAFMRFLRLTNSAIPADRAWKDVFGEDVAAFQSNWAKHVLSYQPPAFANGRAQIEYLAEGLLEMARRDVHPETVEDLAEYLLDIDYEMTVHRHGTTFQRRAADFASAIIPGRHSGDQTPVLAFEWPDKRKSEDDGVVLLPIIVTKHLKPTDCQVRWRAAENGMPGGYEIVNRR